MIKRKYVALAIELAGAVAIVAAVYIFFNFAAGLLSAGILAFILGAALENDE
jgi:lipopolysaccharide export LptBFGC system permease protein LptF